MTDQAYAENVSAWREARDKMRPGSKEWEEADAELKKAEAELYKHRK
ncbi:hypothetical protein [Bradyrhizobium zhanjiangense]|nr:hypothetical protein [Bradyrhizobium zhanjiangense]